MLCEACNKNIVIIGIGRKNGKDNFIDWNNRKYHKKCYKKNQINNIDEYNKAIDNIAKKYGF